MILRKVYELMNYSTKKEKLDYLRSIDNRFMKLFLEKPPKIIRLRVRKNVSRDTYQGGLLVLNLTLERLYEGKDVPSVKIYKALEQILSNIGHSENVDILIELLNGNLKAIGLTKRDVKGLFKNANNSKRG